ncbi:MAG: hypothetical protein PHR51_02260 [Patescibacteria group bacterium]|nr:hypothetical protein [Patescibacteria group bacterium]
MSESHCRTSQAKLRQGLMEELGLTEQEADAYLASVEASGKHNRITSQRLREQLHIPIDELLAQADI